MSEESLENKKNYIKKEIEDKGFNLKDFEDYLSKEKSQTNLDLEKILFMEIQAYVVQFQAKNQSQVSQQPSQTNQQNQTKKQIRKNSDESDEEEPEDLWGDFDDLKVSNNNYYDARFSIKKKRFDSSRISRKRKIKICRKRR